MKIYFFWPFKDKVPTSECPESYEFYNTLKNRTSIDLVDNFEDADYMFYMMDLRNCYNLPHYKKNNLNMEMVTKLKNHKDYHKITFLYDIL